MPNERVVVSKYLNNGQRSLVYIVWQSHWLVFLCSSHVETKQTAIHFYSMRGLCRRKMSVCLSECLSHAGILSKRSNKYPNFFNHGVATPFYNVVFPHQTVWQYSHGTPKRRRRMQEYKKSRFSISTNISLYLGNDTRQNYSYSGRLLINRM